MSQKHSHFFADYSELLAHFDIVTVKAGLQSFLQLNRTEAELNEAGSNPATLRKYLVEAFQTLLDRGTLKPLSALTATAQAEATKLQRGSGIDVESLPTPPPPPPTAAELLRQEIAADWLNLPADKIRQKKSASRTYAAMLAQMLNDGSLESQVTAAVIAGA